LVSYFHLLLDGKTRFSLIEDKPLGNMNSFPSSHLDALFRRDATREYLRKIVYEEFGLYPYLSPLKGPNLTLVMDKNPELIERSLTDETIQQFKTSEELRYFGDGIKCFIGILIASISFSRRILLIDEPEAFLHPSATRSLGRHLSHIVNQRNSSLIVATHSSDFLLGCLESSDNITIIRLTRDSA